MKMNNGVSSHHSQHHQHPHHSQKQQNMSKLPPHLMKNNNSNNNNISSGPNAPQNMAQPIVGGAEYINKTMDSLSHNQLYDIIYKMKLLLQQHPQQTKQILTHSPQLAYALLHAQMILGLANNNDVQKALNFVTAAPPSQQQQPLPQQQIQHSHQPNRNIPIQQGGFSSSSTHSLRNIAKGTYPPPRVVQPAAMQPPFNNMNPLPVNPQNNYNPVNNNMNPPPVNPMSQNVLLNQVLSSLTPEQIKALPADQQLSLQKLLTQHVLNLKNNS
eukprot:TRINITY_DN4168_c0_g1_i1.p1 TRINITY_DN4168_c0_g1~~TRINITY_DN4168_c0_g1_i1.p1  ORF type:complete len:271 (+),score=90.19 TRINITY_DN4168_c0_g1_i1:417-1229(+)